MEKIHLPKVGFRKIKSLIAVCVAFLIWQLIRFVLPFSLEIHPLFGYVYAIIELRQTPEETKRFSAYRIKATLIGLALGLSLLPLSVYFAGHIQHHVLVSLADLGLILVGVLVAITLAELFKCKNLSGVAAIIFVICIIRDRTNGTNIYVYAILRIVQTLIGVFSAWLVNTYLLRKHSVEEVEPR